MFGRIKSFIGNVRRSWTEISDGYSFTSYMRNWGTSKSRHELLYEYKNLVYQCVTTIAQNVARYEPLAEKPTAGGETIQVRDNGLINLLKAPSPYMSQYDLIEASETFRLLTGEFFWYLELGQQTRKPKSITILRPDRMKVAIDKNNGEVIGYTVRRDDGTEMPLDLDEVLHYKNFNPTNPYRGLGVVEANLLYIETENTASAFQYNYLKNQATPSGVLTFRADNKGTIDKEAFRKAKLQWDEQYSGEANAGKTLFVREMDVKFEKVGLSLADLDMAGLKQMTDDKVMEAFKVPVALLGKVDGSGLGRSNIEAIEYIFAKYTIDPIQEKYDDFFSMAHRRYWGKDTNIEIDHISQVPEDKEFRLQEYNAGVGKWITRNEARKYYGRLPMDGGDQLYVGFNEVPINQSVDSSSISNSNSTGKTVKLILKKKSDLTTKATAEETFISALSRNEKQTERQYESTIKKLIVKQEKEVIESLQSHLGKAYEEITPDEVSEAANWLELLLPIIYNSIENAGKLGLKFLNVEDQIQFVLTQGARDQIFNSEARLLRSFNQEITDKIQKQLVQGVNNGESLPQLTKRVEDVYAEAKGYRAKRIANTEGHKASNFGVREAYKSAGVKKMVWRANPGACEFCQAMDGQVADIGGSFLSQGATVTGVDGGEYVADYDDVQLADLHPNCTCNIMPAS